MAKIYANLFQSDNNEDAAEENVACRVVITCKQPTPDGEMQVEMNYEGDKVLASYLLQSAHQMLEE